jgi:signal transduction histidine kinase
MSIHLLLGDTLGPLNEKQAELLIAAREEGGRLAGILDHLLDMNRLEAGKARLEMRPIAPQVLAREGLEPFFAEARAKGVSLVNAVPLDLPEVTADLQRMVHVFANLASNALRFTPPGGTITVRALAEPDAVRFIMEDTGSGVAPEHAAHVFESFFRAPGQQANSGIGLGLAIVKEIVEVHGGRVGVERSPEGGAAFWFTLPTAEGSKETK